MNSVSPSDAIENTDTGAEQQDVEFGHSRDPSHVRLRESSEEDPHRPPNVEESMIKVFSLLVTRLENSEARYEADKARSSMKLRTRARNQPNVTKRIRLIVIFAPLPGWPILKICFQR